MVVLGDGRQAALEVAERLRQPLRHDGDESAEEDDGTENGEDHGDGSTEHALVVSEISRIRDAEECPPDRLVGPLETGIADQYDKSGDGRDQSDRGCDDQKAEVSTPDEHLLETELEPVD